jgi:hypothetical protein
MLIGDPQLLRGEEIRHMLPNRFFEVKVLMLLLFVVALSSTCSADELDTIVTQTRSSDPELRADAFEALQSYLAQVPIDPRAVTAVIDLLVLETSSADSVDGDAEYFSDLITSAVNLNDPSAIPSLVGVIGSGNMVPRRLAQYGTAALDQVIARATDQDWIVRKCVMITLTNMLSPANLPLVNDPQSLAKINATLSQGALDSSSYVSESALVGLQQLADKTPPATTAVALPGPNASGWNNANVAVTLNSTDNESGGTGVKQITYSATGAQTVASTVVNGASASFTISAEGVTTLTFFGADNAGNVESAKTLAIQLDKTPPSIAGMRSPAPNANGWNNTNVTVSFQCSDALSGLAGGSPPAPTALSSEGARQSVRGTCTDIAGNSATSTVSGINIDKTPPTVACSATPNVLWPPNNKLVPVNLSVGVTDALSGPAGFTLVSVTSSEPDSGQGDIQGFLTGTASTNGKLRAQRLGSGSGRVYTFTYNGADQAGNTASCTTTVTVPHDQGQN